VRVARPFALIGRISGADVQIEDRAVSGRHVYLHLDRRGLFAVDLATRTGTRFGNSAQGAAWLRPGDALEIADRKVEVLEVQVWGGDPPLPGGPSPADPLGDAGDAPLARLTLYPDRPPGTPRSLSSELVFLGRGACCGIRVEGPAASKTHCVLVRTRRGAYAVDLMGRGTWLNSRPLRGGSPLNDGDALMIGSTQFEVRVEPITSPSTALARHPAARPPATTRAPAPPVVAEGHAWPAEIVSGIAVPMPPVPLPSEAQGALLAWIATVVQAGQGEALRRQGEFQQALTQLIGQICVDNATLMSEHLQRMEKINQELASLRNEIRQRFGTAAPPPAPALPFPKPPPLRIAPVEPSSDPEGSTSWLIDRVKQLEEENRSTWKDLLSRLSGQPRQAP
jgi:hypothetical protein